MMRHPIFRHLSIAASSAAALLCASAGLADDTEIFIAQPAANVQANILLIIDTSGSMNETAGTTPLPYDPTYAYPDGGANGDAKCSTSRIYYSTSATTPNSCENLSYIQLSGSFSVSNPREIKCKAAVTQLAWGGGQTGSGYFTDRFIRWRGPSDSRTWSNNLANTSNATDVECAADAENHGSSNGNYWPRMITNNSTPGVWTTTASSSWWTGPGNDGTSATFYSPNYIRYVRNPPVTVQTRMDVVKAAAGSFLNSLPNVNLGVMRYSANGPSYVNTDANAAGGMVTSSVSPLDSKRANLISEITTSNLYEPFGWTPLSETLFEAYRYFSGGPVTYGSATGALPPRFASYLCNSVSSAPGTTGFCDSAANWVPFPSVAASHNGVNYISPAVEPCQKNFIIFLTDGLPTQDAQANSLITGLPNFAALGGACDTTDSYSGTGGAGAGRCLGALAQYMHNDLNDLNPNVSGNQTVTSYFIGFGADVAGAAAFGYLQTAATRGGGQAYQATDLTGLSGVFNAIATEIFQTSTTFTTPTVAVNAFNRTQTLDDIFVSVFQPNSSLHWPGNLKKYRVVDGVIKDQDNENAVDPNTGFFADTSRSYWSSAQDGSDITQGGAADELDTPASRNLYTYLGANPMGPQTLGSAHEVIDTNDTLDSYLMLGAPGDPTADELINWARGVDVLNEDGDASTTTRGVMGDPIHSPPTIVIYGGTTSSPDINDGAVFVATNDGYLHAIDPTDGEELWAFIPQELLGNLKNLYFDDPVPAKQYTLDGQIRILRYDVNGDGIIDAGANDRVLLFVGQGRGGDKYYALDVTSKTSPKYLWTIGATALPGIGQAWSTPAIARVNVSGESQNSQKLALIIGGGYDPDEDGVIYLSSSSVGNRIFIVDALHGNLLWSGGPDSSGADFEHDRMVHSIPGGITVLDTDSDGYADRMYAGDMAAQLWRFDITNGNDADALVEGGVIASLGTHDDGTPVPAKARRFYSAPDVAAMARPGMLPFLNIAIGSGYRGHPLNTVVRDRFYTVRDHNAFNPLTQSDYDNLTVITDADLQDITTDTAPTIPASSSGWKLLLNRPAWQGEKSLSPSNTFDNKIFFTTYTPPTGSPPASCEVGSTGTNRAYVVSALDGSPVRQGAQVIDPDTGQVIPPPPEDRYEDLQQGGIAPEVAFLFPEADAIVCLSGVEVLGACTTFDSRIKTFWHESGAN